MKKLYFPSLFALLVFCSNASAQTQSKTQAEIPCKVIRKVHYPVTQKNPSSQPLRIALLDLCPENPGMVARPMLSFMIDGKITMREYDVVKVFKTEKEARKYAKKNKIEDISF
ncbi:MAG: hypothetical protein ABWZ66_02270 [Pyrinomonadaceae bacterium]